jgi:hypothetical protein
MCTPNLKEGRYRLGAVAHPCNLSSLRGRDQEDNSLRPALAKSETFISINKPGVVAQSAITDTQEDHCVRRAWAKSQDPT